MQTRIDLGGNPYILGLDLGPSSLGWAIIACTDDGDPLRIVKAGVRIFDAGVMGDLESGRDESRATQRRDARAPRRQTWRRQWRMRKVYRLLVDAGLLPDAGDTDPDTRHQAIQKLDAQLHSEFVPEADRVASHVLPYRLRAMAVEQPLAAHALGRALYHLAQHRGFLSNSKAVDDDEEHGKVKSGIVALYDEMNGAPLGQYFAGLDPEEARIRARWTSRHMYLAEFEQIWQAQCEHHDALTDEFKEKLHHALYYQRPLKSQAGRIGRCDLEPDQRRAPLASLPAQRFRIRQRVNDLRYTAPDGEIHTLDREQREMLVAALESKPEMTWGAVRTLFKMRKSKEYGRNYVFNMEEEGSNIRLVGNRTAAKLADVLGETWTDLSADEQERLVEEKLARDDDAGFARRLETAWDMPADLAQAAAAATLEPGYASHSLRAMKKLLPLIELDFCKTLNQP